ncbi:MAG: hypothetical protein ACFHWZ_17265 [Phycisphaerales bacterium]
MTRKTALVGAAMLVAACAGSANAQTYAYNVDFNAPGAPGVNNNGGTFDSLSTTFNHSTNRLTFSVTFANQVTKGFTLAINGGANPKGHGGEMALFYFDASSLAAPKLTAYNYNGQNNITSYFDGDGATAGIQAPDKIQSNGDLGVGDTVSAQDSGGKRTLSFSIDASTIIGHNPLYGTPGDWTVRSTPRTSASGCTRSARSTRPTTRTGTLRTFRAAARAGSTEPTYRPHSSRCPAPRRWPASACSVSACVVVAETIPDHRD